MWGWVRAARVELVAMGRDLVDADFRFRAGGKAKPITNLDPEALRFCVGCRVSVFRKVGGLP